MINSSHIAIVLADGVKKLRDGDEGAQSRLMDAVSLWNMTSYRKYRSVLIRALTQMPRERGMESKPNPLFLYAMETELVMDRFSNAVSDRKYNPKHFPMLAFHACGLLELYAIFEGALEHSLRRCVSSE